MVDLLLRPLHPMGKPRDDVVGVVWKDLMNVVEPRLSCSGISELGARGPIQIEQRHSRTLDPAAVHNETVVDELRHAWTPCHLLRRPVPIEPRAGQNGYRI